METEHKKQQWKHSSSTKPERITNGRNIQQEHNLNSNSNIRDTIKNLDQHEQSRSSSTISLASSIQERQKWKFGNNTTATKNREQEKQQAYLSGKQLEDRQENDDQNDQKQDAGYTFGVDGLRLQGSAKRCASICSHSDEEGLLTNHLVEDVVEFQERRRQRTRQISVDYSKADQQEPQGTIKQATIVCSPTDDDDYVLTVPEHTDHPVDDFIAVKTFDFHIRHDEESEMLNRNGTLTSENDQPIGIVTVKDDKGLIRAVHPLKKESESTVACQELVPAKKEFDGDDPVYNDDEYLYVVRGITSIPHDFAPERVVTPVYTVPRYPDNHNPLLPLSLQKKLGEPSSSHYSYHGTCKFCYHIFQSNGMCIFKTGVEC